MGGQSGVDGPVERLASARVKYEPRPHPKRVDNGGYPDPVRIER